MSPTVVQARLVPQIAERCLFDEKVRRDDPSAAIHLEFGENKLTAGVSVDLTADWIATEKIGMKACIDIGNGRFLPILI